MIKLEKYYLTIGSVTKAIMARDLLRKNGISAQAAKTPSGYSKDGCGYSVVIHGNPNAAADILSQNNITVTGVIKGRF